ncbi:hypothetical protein [Streptomyces seoulensis]|uniref:hypothetical protein n=1 Tax=Streptomyces seoulensis TaxID=73044 RepID=UPI001FCC10BE|nr:hypothetical protein [Streptomyces seoulensis]BDH04889.1 hypothetical protein HEK131_21160 [Streptomyces seoulensis]
MRVRLTDGSLEVEITAPAFTRHGMHRIEHTAHRLLARLRQPAPADDDQDDEPFGFTRDLDLDRVSLDATTERAEPYYEPGRDDYDDEDDDL